MEEHQNFYYDIDFGFNYWGEDGVMNKKLFVRRHIQEMLNRTGSLFKYENLPKDVDERMLELYLQTYGACFFTKVEDKYYVFRAGYGGEPDVYYRPTVAIVANPALRLSKEYKIGEDGIVCINDTMMQGLIPTFSLYGSLIAENIISMRLALINNRHTATITATTDANKKSAELYLKRLSDGEQGVMLDKSLGDGIHVQPVRQGNDNALTALIEHQQYLKASEFNAIGINANYNMKRESITSSESDLNNESLFPMIDDMLECRKKWIDLVNALYGLDISVDLSSVWKHKKQASELEIITTVNELASTLHVDSPEPESTQVDNERSDDNGNDSNDITDNSNNDFTNDNIDSNFEDTSEVETPEESILDKTTENMVKVVEELTKDVLSDLEIATDDGEEGENDEEYDETEGSS